MQRNDTEQEFISNVDKLFKLIKNVIEKGKHSTAEKYLVYLFDVLTEYYGESANVRNLRDEFADNLRNLINKQIGSGNFKVFSFILGLLKDAIVDLFKTTETTPGAARLIDVFKHVSAQIFLNENTFTAYERQWYLDQTHEWFVDLYSVSVNTTESLKIVENEIREILKQYVENDKVDLFDSFLNALSSRFFAFDFNDEKVIQKYREVGRYDSVYQALIGRYLGATNKLLTIKGFLRLMENFNNDISTNQSWPVDVAEFKSEIGKVLFNNFKKQYAKLILIEAICFSFFRRKFDFFEAYLHYHSPNDADANWLNDNYSIQSFLQLIPFLEDYQQFGSHGSFWEGRHSLTTYLNTFIGYFLVKANPKKIDQYVADISESEKISAVLYNLRSVKEKNILIELPSALIADKKLVNYTLWRLVYLAEERQKDIDEHEQRTLPIDIETRDTLFSGFFDSFNNQAVARSIYAHYNRIINSNENGLSIGISQLLPRKAFIKQSGTYFMSPHAQLATIVADDDSGYIFSILEKRAQFLSLSRKEFEEYIKVNSNKFDLLISKNTFSIKANFPNISFEEGWSLNTPFKNKPGYLGKLNGNLDVFLSNQTTPLKNFMLLNSGKIGQLVNCRPPELDVSEETTLEQFRFSYSFIDLENNTEIKQKLLAKGHGENELRKEVWIRIFESIKVELPENFEAINIEITT